METPTKQEAIHALTQLGVNSPEAERLIEGLPETNSAIMAISARADVTELNVHYYEIIYSYGVAQLGGEYADK